MKGVGFTSLYDELRNKFDTFVYYGYKLENSTLTYHFGIKSEALPDKYDFYPTWTFPFNLETLDSNREQADEIIFSLGMAELISYWKCCCPPEVEIRCGYLSDWKKSWWKKLYYNGLGEFFYRNEINADFDGFMNIICTENRAPKSFGEFSGILSGALVPVGGGKDSVVTLEMLKKAGEDITPFMINGRKAIRGCIEAAGIASDKAVCFNRTIDKTLLELNKKGFLNGHTPFLAVVAFSAELCACFLNKKYVVLSNESSANETYVEGKNVNHQYSKSTEFEKDFREYCAKTFGSCAEYFSLLRPLSEWQIAREFVKYPQYFPVFQSCNLGGKTDIWCCNCAKCLYVYILLAAFLDDEELVKIFGCNMLNKTELSDMFDGLVLDGEDKPFECVGTKNEVRLSLKMALEKRRENAPPLLRRFAEKFPDYQPADLTKFFDKNNFVPDKFLEFVEMAANEI